MKSGPTSFLKKGSQALRVEVIDTATGQDVRQVNASRFYWKPEPGDAAMLGAAAAQALTTPQS